MSELPVACTLSPGELAARRDALQPGIAKRATSVANIASGLCFTFASESGLLAELAHVIDAERQCCPFLRFELTVESAPGEVSLKVSGPEGTQQMLLELLS